jgi:hypothetical protein
MARVKRLLKHSKLKASTLIEVTTALVLISMVFTMALVIYLNVQRSGFSGRKLQNSVLMDEAYNEVMKTKEFRDREMNYDDVTLSQIVNRQDQGLVMLRFEIRNEDGKLLSERKYLVYDPV